MFCATVEVREQRALLRHVADAALLGGHVRPWLSSSTRSPIRTVPASGRTKPATIRSSVLLPQPDGPSTPVIEPLGTCRSRSTSTGFAP